MASVIERLRELFNGCDHNRANCYGTCKCDHAIHAALLALADAVESKDPARIESALAELKKEAQ